MSYAARFCIVGSTVKVVVSSLWVRAETTRDGGAGFRLKALIQRWLMWAIFRKQLELFRRCDGYVVARIPDKREASIYFVLSRTLSSLRGVKRGINAMPRVLPD